MGSISVCIDWLDGWTSHSDTLTTLAEGVAVGGATRAIGGNTGEEGEETPPAEVPVPDNESLTRIINEAVTRGLESRISDTNQILPTATPTPSDAPITLENTIRSIQADVIGEVSPLWRNHAVDFLEVQTMKALGRSNSSGLETAYTDKRMKMTEDQFGAEIRAAAQFIEDADIPKRAKQRVKAKVFRLLTTVDPANPETGTLLVPVAFFAEIHVAAEEYGVVRKYWRNIGPIETGEINLFNVASKPSAFWIGKCRPVPLTSATFGKDTMKAEMLGAILPWCDTFNRHQTLVQLSDIAKMIGEAFSEAEDKAGFIGDGSPVFGNFTGLLNLAGADTYTMPVGMTSIADLTFQDLNLALGRMPRSSRKNAKWFVGTDVPTVLRGLTDANGRFIFSDPTSTMDVPRIWGREVVEVSVLPGFAEDAVSLPFIGLADPSFLYYGDEKEFEISISKDATLFDLDGNGDRDTVAHALFQENKTAMKAIEAFGVGFPRQDTIIQIETAAV